VAENDGKIACDDALALHLASGVSVPKAAERAGVSERTAYRRLEDPAFRLRVDRLRTEAVGQTVGKLSAAGEEAVDALVLILKHGQPHAVKLGAARAILQLLFAGHEQFTLARRVEELEQLVAGREKA
jgi:hypothetical protein